MSTNSGGMLAGIEEVASAAELPVEVAVEVAVEEAVEDAVMEDQTRMNGKTLLSVAFMGKPTVSSALPNQMKSRVGLSRIG